MLGPQPGQDLRLTRTEPVLVETLGQAQEEIAVLLPHPLILAGVDQPLPAVLPDGLQQAVAGQTLACGVLHQGLGDQPVQQVKRLAGVDAIARAHALDRVEAETPGEH